MRNASARLPLVSAVVVWIDKASFIESTEFETSLLDSEVESWPAVAAAGTDSDLSTSSSEASACGSVMDHDGIGGGRTVSAVSVAIGSEEETEWILV